MAMATAVHEYKSNPTVAIPLVAEIPGRQGRGERQGGLRRLRQGLSRRSRPSLAGMALVLKEIARKEPKAAAMKPEQFVDTSMLDALEREGFFKTLRTAN